MHNTLSYHFQNVCSQRHGGARSAGRKHECTNNARFVLRTQMSAFSTCFVSNRCSISLRTCVAVTRTHTLCIAHGMQNFLTRWSGHVEEDTRRTRGCLPFETFLLSLLHYLKFICSWRNTESTKVGNPIGGATYLYERSSCSIAGSCISAVVCLWRASKEDAVQKSIERNKTFWLKKCGCYPYTQLYGISNNCSTTTTHFHTASNSFLGK